MGLFYPEETAGHSLHLTVYSNVIFGKLNTVIYFSHNALIAIIWRRNNNHWFFLFFEKHCIPEDLWQSICIVLFTNLYQSPLTEYFTLLEKTPHCSLHLIIKYFILCYRTPLISSSIERNTHLFSFLSYSEANQNKWFYTTWSLANAHTKKHSKVLN